MATGMLWQKYEYKQRKNIYQLQDGGYLAWEGRVSDRWEGISLAIHLTPEQHGFELCRSTYTQIFSTVDTTVLHDPQLLESMDVEPHIWRNWVSGGLTLIYMQVFDCPEGQGP